MTVRLGLGSLMAAAIGMSVLCLVSGWTTPLAAQDSPLDRAERLSGVGHAEDARAALLEWWEGDRSEATRADLQRGLWLRGRLTVDPTQAILDYQRLVVLYPGGTYTDRALWRLAQARHALGDGPGAERHIADLVRDYPNSRIRGEAESWLATAGPPPDPPTPAEESEVAESSADPDPASDLEDTVPTSTAPPTPTPTEDVVAAEPVAAEFSVQLGAFGELVRATSVFDAAGEAGFDPRVVRVEGSDLYHVRVGAFVERASAQTLLDRVAGTGIIAAIVRDAREEEIVAP